MDFSLTKSFKSNGSYKLSKRINPGADKYEELPILSNHKAVEEEEEAKQAKEEENRRRSHQDLIRTRSQDLNRRRSLQRRETMKDEVIVEIDDSKRSFDEKKMSSEDSFHFNANVGNKDSQSPAKSDDPPTRLIGQFLHKQKKSGDFALDMDLEMEELQPRRHSSAVDSDPANEISRRRIPRDDSASSSSSSSSDAAEVVRCSSTSTQYRRDISFKKRSGILHSKTKSRLQDPPEAMDRRSGRVAKSGPILSKSGQVPPRSGQVKRVEEEEDDPFMDEDLPEEFKRSNFDAVTLLQWASLILIVGALCSTLSIDRLRRKNLWELRLWKWEVLVLVLICGRLVSGWGIRIAVFFVESNFLLRKRVLYFVYGVRKAVQNSLWLALVLTAWHFLFDKRVERETRSVGLRYVTKLLVCFLIATLLWLVKTLIVKVLASSYHVSTYFDRIQDSLFNQFVIETLSGPPISAEVADGGSQLAAEDRGKMSRVLSKGGKGAGDEERGITIDHLHKLNPRNVSAWNMKRLMRMVRHGALTTLDEEMVDNSSTGQIRTEVEAKAAAKQMFQNVAIHGSKFIYLEDLMRFMQEEEAMKTMSLFEGASESNRISKSSLKNWVVNAFRERRALALTLNDTKTAVNKLHRMVNVIVGIIIIVISLLILGIATTKFLLFVSSQLVLVAFVFGNTCKTVFEAIIFLFVMHPFDVGDRCEIEGVQMVVEEMNILTTVFLRYDNTKVIIPNSVLATKAINNFYRSPDMGDGVEFFIHVATPAEKIAALRQRITNYVECKKEHWYPSPMIIMKDLEDLTRVKMAVWLCHRINHQDMGERYLRRSALIEEMVKIFKELDIQFRLLPLEINVRAMPTINSHRLG